MDQTARAMIDRIMEPMIVRSSCHTPPTARRHAGEWWRRALLSVALMLLVAAPAGAQQNVLDLRLLELDEDGDRTYHNFLYSRSFGDSRLSLEAFWLFLPQEGDYDEFGVGLGYRLLTLGDTNVSLIGYLSSAPDDEYFEPALFAFDVEGKLTWSCFLLHYLPLGDGGIDQWLVDPIEIQYNVGGPVSIGASGYFYRPQGGSWLTKFGPKVSIADKYGASELAVRDVNDGGGLEIQLRRIFVF